MNAKFIDAAVTILIAIIGVAVVAVLVSKQSQTPGVIGAGSQGFADALKCALSPITGAPCSALRESVNSTITFGT